MGVTQVLLTTLHRTQQALTVRPRRPGTEQRVGPAARQRSGVDAPVIWRVLSPVGPRLRRHQMRPGRAGQGARQGLPASCGGSAAGGDRRRAVEAVEPAHPAQRLLDSPNPFWTRGDLWRATETSLGLWGSAFWGLERDETGQVTEIWPLRSDRMRVIPDPARYIKGFVYVGRCRQIVSYLAEDVVWIRLLQPADEYAGLSPIAPLRLSADMGTGRPPGPPEQPDERQHSGLFVETEDTPTDDEVRSFTSDGVAASRG